MHLSAGLFLFLSGNAALSPSPASHTHTLSRTYRAYMHVRTLHICKCIFPYIHGPAKLIMQSSRAAAGAIIIILITRNCIVRPRRPTLLKTIPYSVPFTLSFPLTCTYTHMYVQSIPWPLDRSFRMQTFPLITPTKKDAIFRPDAVL